MSGKFSKGTLVWVRHPTEAWTPGTVGDILDDVAVQVFFPDGSTKKVKISTNHPLLRTISCNGDIQSLETADNANISDDLTKVTQLITPAVLHLLRIAYDEGKFYCKLGSGTLLALNPFREVNRLFTFQAIQLYNSSSLGELQTQPAHIYSVAQNALVAMQSRIGRTNQSIVVSGESGAGKTWTVRNLMRYFSQVESMHKRISEGSLPDMQTKSSSVMESVPLNFNNSNTSDLHFLPPLIDDTSRMKEIEERILDSNPVLEAFGNAKTLRNSNSSRFGKYIQLEYNRSGRIVGAQLRTYLLEKTRVVRHDPGERCYHIFYQMMYGAVHAEKEDWSLPDNPFPDQKEICDDFVLEQTAGLEETRLAMYKLGISQKTQCRIFMLLSAILHLRQLTFQGSDDLIHQSTLDPSCRENFHIATGLLGIDHGDLLEVITLRKISTRNDRRRSVFMRPATVEECLSRRDSLLKFLYQLLFQWIVRGVGMRISAPVSESCSFIGLLDIYGFESFKTNSLEQLCINYANEKLQHHFIMKFLGELQEEYLSEGIQWQSCDLSDNIECLSAIEAPRKSLFSLLNEECKLNRAHTENQLKNRVELMFGETKHIVRPRVSNATSSFSILHYAGEVPYNTDLLIEKNKDHVPSEFLHVLAMSTNGFVRQLTTLHTRPSSWQDTSTTQKRAGGDPLATVVTQFKKSLDDLLEILSSTDCHYIRCIKPNKHSLPKIFDSKFVLDQMEACGIVDTIKVCATPFPYRMNYKQFNVRYSFCLSHFKDVAAQEIVDAGSQKFFDSDDQLLKEKCLRILQSTGKKSINTTVQFGKTKVFLSSEQFERLELLRSEQVVGKSVVIQTAWRGYMHRKKCRATRKALLLKRNMAATILQKAWRMKIHLRMERELFIAQRKRSVLIIESAWISYRLHVKSQRERSATMIQAVFRGWRARCRYKESLALSLTHHLDNNASHNRVLSSQYASNGYFNSSTLHISSSLRSQGVDISYGNLSRCTQHTDSSVNKSSGFAEKDVLSLEANRQIFHVLPEHSGSGDAYDSLSYPRYSSNRLRSAKIVNYTRTLDSRASGDSCHPSILSVWQCLPSVCLLRGIALVHRQCFESWTISASGGFFGNAFDAVYVHLCQTSLGASRIDDTCKRSGKYCILKYADVRPNI